MAQWIDYSFSYENDGKAIDVVRPALVIASDVRKRKVRDENGREKSEVSQHEVIVFLAASDPPMAGLDGQLSSNPHFFVDASAPPPSPEPTPEAPTPSGASKK